MLKLTPIINHTIFELIEEKYTIRSLINSFGSPLNIIFPENLSGNINSFQNILNKHHLKNTIFYAHKANKSKALVKQAKYEGISIDVASENELCDALFSGYNGNAIEVTGPKNKSFLILALQQNCLIQVDNFEELEQISSLQKKLKLTQQTNILIRFNGFISSGTKVLTKDSRFGIYIKHYKKVIEYLTNNKNINLQGFSYHLDSNTSLEKAIALEKLIQLYGSFQEAGLAPNIINIGGGFKINYLTSEKEWSNFIGSLQQAAIGNIPPVTWHNTNFGYYKDQNTIHANTNFYEYYNKTAGADYLDEILSTNLPSLDNNTAARMISELMLQLAIEPGRAILNQTGITIARVNFVKQSPGGEILVGLDMNRSNLASTDQEMLLDPIVIYKNKNKTNNKYGVYFVGNLCLESDFIYKHKTFLNQLPATDDLVVFINTAAYNMDFTESATIQQKIARKIAIIKRNNKFLWFEDNVYNPYLVEETL